jgi:hypothetical protein
MACDLEARLGIIVPGDFNPLVHESGSRMRRLKEWTKQSYNVKLSRGGSVSRVSRPA